MLILRHCHQNSQDLITCEQIMLRFVAGKRTPVESEFNVWDHTIPEIYGIILGMFIKLDLLECLNISEGELLDFIIDVDKGYLSIYYHSFYHAADVTAVLYRMLTEMNASQYLCKPDMAALLLAGLCHDIGHPGLNNLYQVNAKTEVVKVHGEASVLEKYSCSMAMDLVTKHRIFRNVEKSPAAMLPEGNQATEGHMRDAMVKAIMATDMSFHYDMLNNLNSLVEFTATPTSTPSHSDDSETATESEESDSDVDPSPTPSPTQSGPSSSPITALETKVSNEAAVPTSAVPLMAVAVDSSCSRFSCPVSRHHQRQLSSSSTTSDSSATSLSSRGSTETAHSTATGSRFPVDLTQELRQNLCNCLLHAADISNAVKPWALCKRWSDLVVQEFFRQGDIEKAQSLPVSPNMDRDQHNQPQISLGFSDFVVHPYFASLAELLPGSAPLLETLASNREQWVVLQKELEQSKKENGTVDSTAGAIATPHLEINQGSFNRHAAYDSPTFDNSSEPSRTGSPLPEHLVPGRRVSVAAGVVVLDDSRPPLRTSHHRHRRIRHSTNTDGSTPGIPHRQLMLRKIKRSHSGKSLSSIHPNSPHPHQGHPHHHHHHQHHHHHPHHHHHLNSLNYGQHSAPVLPLPPEHHAVGSRPAHLLSKKATNQDGIASMLKREAALAGRDSTVSLQDATSAISIADKTQHPEQQVDERVLKKAAKDSIASVSTSSTAARLTSSTITMPTVVKRSQRQEGRGDVYGRDGDHDSQELQESDRETNMESPLPPQPQPRFPIASLLSVTSHERPYHRRRHGSLQLDCTSFPDRMGCDDVEMNMRDEYRDGYIVWDDQDPNIDQIWNRCNGIDGSNQDCCDEDVAFEKGDCSAKDTNVMKSKDTSRCIPSNGNTKNGMQKVVKDEARQEPLDHNHIPVPDSPVTLPMPTPPGARQGIPERFSESRQGCNALVTSATNTVSGIFYMSTQKEVPGSGAEGRPHMVTVMTMTDPRPSRSGCGPLDISQDWQELTSRKSHEVATGPEAPLTPSTINGVKEGKESQLLLSPSKPSMEELGQNRGRLLATKAETSMEQNSSGPSMEATTARMKM